MPSRLLPAVVLAAFSVILAAGGCRDGGQDPDRLDGEDVEAIANAGDLVAAVAESGVTSDGARAAALAVTRDAVAYTEAVADDTILGRRFQAEVLRAEPDLVTLLVAAGVEGLVGRVYEAGQSLMGLSPEFRVIQSNQQLSVETGTFDSDNVFRALARAGDDAGVDEGERWAALLGVLDVAAESGASRGSFVDDLGDRELSNIAPAEDAPPVPDDDATFRDTVADDLRSLLVDALYDDSAVRGVLAGDEGVSREDFAADPFVETLLDPRGTSAGGDAAEALADLLASPR